MIVTVQIEDADYVNATKPFYNGCSFRAIFMADGYVFLEPGCYFLVNLAQGAERYFYEQWKAAGKKPFRVELSPEAKMEIMGEKPCRHCGGHLFEENPRPCRVEE